MALKQDSVHFILYLKRGMNKIEGVVLNRGRTKKKLSSLFMEERNNLCKT